MTTLLPGYRGAGKTTAALDFGIAGATGGEFLGVRIRRGRTLVLSYDMLRGAVLGVIHRLARGRGLEPTALDGRVFVLDGFEDLGGKRLQDIEDEVRMLIERHHINYVLVDAWQSALGGDVLNHEFVHEMMKMFDRLAVTDSGRKLVVIVLSQVPKPQEDGKPGKTAFGSGFKEFQARAIHRIELERQWKVAGDVRVARLMWNPEKVSLGWKEDPFPVFRIDDATSTRFQRYRPRDKDGLLIPSSLKARVPDLVDEVLRNAFEAERFVTKPEIATVVATRLRAAYATVYEYVRQEVNIRTDLESHPRSTNGRPEEYRLAKPVVA